MALVREVGYAQRFSFKYSPRPGTPAAAARKQIAEDVKSARLAGAAGLAAAAAGRRSTAPPSAGRWPVLFEKPGRNPGQAVGRSPICSRCMSKRRAV